MNFSSPTPADIKGGVAAPGALYVVATPIGNIGDLSSRALSILRTCDLIACEDTRTTGLLLKRLDIDRPLVSYHEHNEREQAASLANHIKEGKSIALVSDAGTPSISDPGFRLVRECRRNGLPVIPIPGPSALVAAISASGLPANGFFFVGFLPPKSAARARFFEKYRDFPFTICLYESTHRIEKLVAEIVEILGAGRCVCIAKELTKLHEQFFIGPAGNVRAALTRASLKGEFVVLIAPAEFEL